MTTTKPQAPLELPPEYGINYDYMYPSDVPTVFWSEKKGSHVPDEQAAIAACHAHANRIGARFLREAAGDAPGESIADWLHERADQLDPPFVEPNPERPEVTAAVEEAERMLADQLDGGTNG